jgi:hypothetical protein
MMGHEDVEEGGHVDWRKILVLVVDILELGGIAENCIVDMFPFGRVEEAGDLGHRVVPISTLLLGDMDLEEVGKAMGH